MKKTMIFFLLTLSVVTAKAQDISQLELQADEWTKRNYTQTKALGAYLACFRLSNDKNVRFRMMDKMASIIVNRNLLMSKDAIIVDSLIEEGRPTLGKDAGHYLPLLEQRIMKASSSTEKYQNEFRLFDEAVRIRTDNKLLKGTDYEQLLRWYVGKLFYKKELSNEDKLKAYASLWEVYRQNSPSLDSLDIKLLDNYASHLGKDPQTSVMLHELKKEYIIMKNGKDSEEYMKILQSLYLEYYRLYSSMNSENSYKYTPEMEKEIEYRTELYQLKKSKGKEIPSSDVQGIIFNLTAYKKDTLTARKLAVDYAELEEKTHGKESLEYCQALNLVVDTYKGEDKDAIPLLRELLALQEKVLGKDDIAYKSTSGKLTFSLSQNHQMQEAINMMRGKSQEDDMSSLMLLSSRQAQYGLYREAIETYTKMMDYCVKYPQEMGLYLISSTLGVINSYNKLKDVSGLLAFGRKWSNEKSFSIVEQKYVFSNVVSVASQPANVNEDVVKYIDEFVLSHPSLMGSLLERAEVMEQKATAYLGLSQFGQSEKVVRQILTSLRQAGADVRVITKYEQYLEICLMAEERLDDALLQNQNVLAQMSQMPGYKTLLEYRSLCCRAAIYQDRKDNFDEVLRLCSLIDGFDDQQATQMFANTSFCFSTFSMLTNYLNASSVEKQRYRALLKKGKMTEAESFILEDADKKMSLLKFTLSQMDNSMQQNSSLWTRQFNDNLINIALFAQTDSLAIKAYDYTLVYKQAFLTTENLMRQQLLESGNDDVKSKFTELQNLRTTIQQYESADMPTKELNERLMLLEKQLVEDSKMYGDFTNSLNLTWEDVRRNLKPADMAIEFLSYDSFEDGKEMIAAILLRSDWKAPKLIPLFAADQVPDKIYERPDFSKLCWTPILQYAKGVKCIYFASAGCLYNINIESLLSPDGQGFLSEKYKFSRISSTRELAFSKNSYQKDFAAVIYGGINYDSTVDDLILDAQKYASVRSTSRSADAVLRGIRGAMSSIPYLPGSKNEAENIVSIIKSRNNEAMITLLTGSAGSETSFKSVSGLPITMLHVSTHGFYDTSKRETKTSTFFVAQQDTEDRVLTRTGLLFAGAEQTLEGDKIPDGIDDGILTSQEISTLDLRNIQLVVLSACQTAQGDITGDGVFGLQRGFKKAGVQSILMSLWKVDDEATCLLMTEFYKNWIGEGKTKHDALELAKQSVRSHKEKGWDDPKYWAAFILLDALD